MWISEKTHIYRGSGYLCKCKNEYVHESKYKLVCPNCGDTWELEPALWDLVRDYRQEKGLGITELARLSGVSRLTIYNIENKCVKPKKKTVLKLAKALGADTNVFLDKAEAIWKPERE